MCKRGVFLFWCCIVVAFGASAQKSACLRLPEGLSAATKLWGASIEPDLKCEELSADAFARRVKNIAVQDLPSDQISKEEIIFRTLKIIPKEYNYRECVYGQVDPKVEALYDPLMGTVLFIKDKDASLKILAHESVHVIQDRYFGLRRLFKTASSSLDATLSLRAMLEGDAIRVEDKVSGPVLEKRGDKIKNRDECVFPGKLEKIFSFPYEYGKSYVEKELNNSSIQKVFQNVAGTTSEILGFIPHVKVPSLKADIKLDGGPEKKGSSVVMHESLGAFVTGVVLGGNNESRELNLARCWVNDQIEIKNKIPAKVKFRWTVSGASSSCVDAIYKALVDWAQMGEGVALDNRAKNIYLRVAGYTVKLQTEGLVSILKIE